MKNIKYIFGLLLIAFSFSACDELGDLLSDDPRDSFVGEWSVEENNTLKSIDHYNVTIEKSASDSTRIRIKNFYAISYSDVVEGVVSGNQVNIPSQTVSGFTIQGYGSAAVNGKTIGWSYTVDHHTGFVDQVTATYSEPL